MRNRLVKIGNMEKHTSSLMELLKKLNDLPAQKPRRSVTGVNPLQQLTGRIWDPDYRSGSKARRRSDTKSGEREPDRKVAKKRAPFQDGGYLWNSFASQEKESVDQCYFSSKKQARSIARSSRNNQRSPRNENRTSWDGKTTLRKTGRFGPEGQVDSGATCHNSNRRDNHLLFVDRESAGDLKNQRRNKVVKAGSG